MNLEILTPEKKLFSDEVYGVQLPGVSGSFEVLNNHAPLISALKSGRIKVLNDKNHSTLFEIQKWICRSDLKSRNCFGRRRESSVMGYGLWI